jgi:hypothetical protein
MCVFADVCLYFCLRVSVRVRVCVCLYGCMCVSVFVCLIVYVNMNVSTSGSVVMWMVINIFLDMCVSDKQDPNNQ